MKKYVCLTGLAKSKQNQLGVDDITHGNVCPERQIVNKSIYPSWNHLSHNRKLHRWSHMRAHNQICEFMRTYIPCYAGSEENIPKHGWIKDARYLFKMLFLISFFPLCQVLLRKKSWSNREITFNDFSISMIFQDPYL